MDPLCPETSEGMDNVLLFAICYLLVVLANLG